MRMVILSVMALSLATLTACGSNGGVSIAVSLPKSSASALSAGSAGGGPLVLDDGTHTLAIASAEVVLRRIEAEMADGSCGSGSEENGDDCGEFESAAMLVSLPLDGSVSQQLAADIPAGEYKQIEFEVHKLGDDSADQAFVAQYPDFAGLSIRVSGTFDSAAFVYTSDLDVEQEIELNPPLVVSGDGASNLTLTVDLSTWFKKADGSLVDPAAGNHGGEFESLVKENIKVSFHGFEDEDEDGLED